MKVSVLASGSKGNCTYINSNNIHMLLDVGINISIIEEKLLENNIDSQLINSVLLTHTHNDHINGLRLLIKKYNPTLYLTEKMYKEINKLINIKNYIIFEDSISIEKLKITPFKTSHDTEESLGYILEENNKSIVYVTDTGYINAKYHQILKNRDIYIIECNHDIELLMNGPYPYHLKRRILSDKGHLSNEDAANYISNFIGDRTKTIILAHLSEINNRPDLALSAVEFKLNKKGKKIDKILVAEQSNKTEMIEI